MLLGYIDDLPGATHTRQAMFNDEEHVAMILEAQENGLKSSAPPLAEYTPEVARLDLLVDIGRQQMAQAARASGAKGVKMPKLQPRPETAVEVMEHRKQRKKSKQLADRFMHRVPEPDQ